MSFNLLKTVQQNLGYPELKKIDPNTQEADLKYDAGVSDKLGQAAIPSVLTGLYKYIETDDGAKEIASGNNSAKWLDLILGDASEALIKRVADYSNCPEKTALAKMNEIADESVKLVREQISKPATIVNVKDFMLSQRNNILPYLPAALQTGKLLNNDTLDDRTNKMKGPVSNFMHGIESIMSGSDNADNSDKF